MSLIEQAITNDGIVTQDKIKIATDRLRSFEPDDGYWLAFSGGKDSIVIKALADMAGVKYESHYSLTTVDPPELVRFIKRHHPDVIIDKPEMTMWELIVFMQFPPTRQARYCCRYLKENGGDGRVTITGVRWAESANRRKNRSLVNIGGKKNGIMLHNDNDESRRMIESCYQKKTTVVNPIIDWSDEDVWEFIHKYKIPYCSLYDEGFKRLGCIGCPLSGGKFMAKDFERWPKYKNIYLRTFARMIEARKQAGKSCEGAFETPDCVMRWWLSDSRKNEKHKNQIEMDEVTP